MSQMNLNLRRALKLFFIYQYEEFEGFVISTYFFNGQPVSEQSGFQVIYIDCEFSKFLYDSEV